MRKPTTLAELPQKMIFLILLAGPSIQTFSVRQV